jgi:hypothetical protein
LRWLGIEPRREDAAAPAADGTRDLPAVARAVVRELDCAVLAMRYPVGDEFAIDLAGEMYRGVFENEQPLPRALRQAVPRAAAGAGRLPLSLATPALFGRHAAELRLAPPPARDETFAVPAVGLGHFPEPPPQFVGRVKVMSEASQALAPRSGRGGVLFHGMAGSGKTACAVELAHHYASLKRFRAFVWYKAPDEDKETDRALANLALAMERQLPGFAMAHLVDRADEFAAWLPKLTAFLARQSILIVLDNLESLLRPNGEWRDENWGRLAAALLAHSGDSRTVLTSRVVPKLALPEPAAVSRVTFGSRDVSAEPVTGSAPAVSVPSRLLALPIHALGLDESALLARQLPNLRRLLCGDDARDEATREHQRGLVVQALRLVQGHPKLLELAEGQAADPGTLAKHLERATAAWAEGSGRLEAFFRERRSVLGEADFLRVLGQWSSTIATTLPEPTRVLFHFLCCLEEEDRQEAIVRDNWGDLWKRLEQPGEPPDLATHVGLLRSVGLVDVRPTGKAGDGSSENQDEYRVHPGVAEAGRTDAGEAFQAAVDRELTAFWRAVLTRGLETEMQGGGRLIERAGLSAAPYLLRQQQWDLASVMLEQVLRRDGSAETLASVLPLCRRIAAGTKGTERELIDAGVLARVLMAAGRVREAEKIQRDIARQATEQGQFRVVSSVMTDLINLLSRTGRFEEALDLVPTMKEHTRRGEFGPWSQLGDEVQRLQLLAALGRHEEVLKSVEQLRGEMRNLPDESEKKELVEPWNVRETILDMGRHSALQLGRWQESLDLNTEKVQIAQARGANLLEIAMRRYNDHDPLLRLQRYQDAHSLLVWCRSVFEARGSAYHLGLIFAALGRLESDLVLQRYIPTDVHQVARRKCFWRQ